MSRSEARRRQRVDAILASAIAAFRRHGYHGTTMEQIADQLLMTKGSLYYYFRDKEEILYAAHERALDRVLRELARVRRGGGCPCEQLERLLGAHIRIMVEGFQGTALALEFDALAPPRLRRVVAKRDRYERALRDLLARGARKGCVRPLDPKLTGMALLGAINWIARWYRDDGPAGPDEVAGRFLDLFFDGVRSRRPAARAAAASSLHRAPAPPAADRRPGARQR